MQRNYIKNISRSLSYYKISRWWESSVLNITCTNGTNISPKREPLNLPIHNNIIYRFGNKLITNNNKLPLCTLTSTSIQGVKPSKILSLDLHTHTYTNNGSFACVDKCGVIYLFTNNNFKKCTKYTDFIGENISHLCVNSNTIYVAVHYSLKNFYKIYSVDLNEQNPPSLKVTTSTKINAIHTNDRDQLVIVSDNSSISVIDEHFLNGKSTITDRENIAGQNISTNFIDKYLINWYLYNNKAIKYITNSLTNIETKTVTELAGLEYYNTRPFTSYATINNNILFYTGPNTIYMHNLKSGQDRKLHKLDDNRIFASPLRIQGLSMSFVSADYNSKNNNLKYEELIATNL